MLDLVSRVEFWVAMAFAVLIKLRASPTLTRVGAVLTTVAAVTGALVFTKPITAWMGLDAETMQFAVAALVALTCEHVARLVLNTTIADAVKMWRGK